jgi:transposase
VPDDPSAAGDELAALRAANARLREANARLRQVAEAKDAEIAALRAALEASQARQAEVITRLELRVAELKRRAGMDSRNSSIPPSKEPLAAKAAEGSPAGVAAGAVQAAQTGRAAGS